ncbi:AraC family transcriptional regulator ligand-binding domain-containing protein [Thalassotalea fonticola]|uniref:AraC family transcriptional regulator ligand-binding domain-containing protein n=1 Tax=Thalassotalea fonticola TaxID=3065649 RepID=A0ABZ0GSQ7_9GAMM|nr:AraC family transcriptional regulator ligand-binding domain-containing protein [Colwelliaceae bacterium S1-1]
MEKQQTAIASYVQVIAKALEHKGVDSKKLFFIADIPLLNANNPKDRIAYQKISHLFRLAVSATKDPYFGLYASKFMLPSHIHALGASLLASKNLLEFLRHFQTFNRFIANTANFSVKEVEHQVIFRCQLLAPICDETQDTFWSFILRFMRHLNVETLNPIKVELHRTIPMTSLSSQPYEKFFACPVTFNHSDIVYYFDKTELIKPLSTASETLVKLNDQVMINYLQEQQTLPIEELVKQKLIQGLVQNCFSKDFIAKSLNMSPRTLQSRLNKNDTSFQLILDQTRFELAKKYIAEGMDLTNIAVQLGFSEASSFSRTFKRWSGVSPQHFKTRTKSE